MKTLNSTLGRSPHLRQRYPANLVLAALVALAFTITHESQGQRTFSFGSPYTEQSGSFKVAPGKLLVINTVDQGCNVAIAKDVAGPSIVVYGLQGSAPSSVYAVVQQSILPNYDRSTDFPVWLNLPLIYGYGVEYVCSCSAGNVIKFTEMDAK